MMIGSLKQSWKRKPPHTEWLTNPSTQLATSVEKRYPERHNPQRVGLMAVASAGEPAHVHRRRENHLHKCKNTQCVLKEKKERALVEQATLSLSLSLSFSALASSPFFSLLSFGLRPLSLLFSSHFPLHPFSPSSVPLLFSSPPHDRLDQHSTHQRLQCVLCHGFSIRETMSRDEPWATHVSDVVNSRPALGCVTHVGQGAQPHMIPPRHKP